ncbi:threonine aldolase [Chloropicon primus]|uniref:Threonine aldolase n=2 Tax=Chloropicon primus TaxID=1764295 RepID=A0A5B8MJ99_9CHLO|nr:threonine aldolase [Chloropicon primus]UPQ99375.1 threonine aldolase [Chloropicon primus]|eukprot:QDZ20164.1 threonine aldolase [Chloropicon primus]
MRVDLRSDTVTKPTKEMLEAIAKVQTFGDDGWGDDDTVKELEREAANLFGKEAGLFTPTGIMANLISVLCHCELRSSEAIVGSLSHICLYEQGGLATLGGVHPRQLPNNSDGTIDLKDIEYAIRRDDPHFPRTRLICLENTQNHCGGRVLSLEYMRSVKALADAHGLPLHLDGARVMNAVTRLGVTPAQVAEHFDTVSFCLSKALGAPVGSVIVGTKDFIRKCHRMRKALGGQLRQVGVLAAPGLIALKKMPSHLAEDHECAKRLGKALHELEGLTVAVEAIETNMVIVDVSRVCADTDEVVEALKEDGVLCAACGRGLLRLATHHQVRWPHIEKTILAFKAFVAKQKGENKMRANGELKGLGSIMARLGVVRDS